MAKKVLRNVKVEWCKFVTPDERYGFRQCNALVEREHQAVLDNWKVGDKVKTKDGVDYIQLRQRKEDFDGNKTGPVPVVGKDLQPIDANTIGNGSTCNLLCDVYDYKGNGGGTAIRLDQVQVLDHIVYGDDESFEMIGDDEPVEGGDDRNPF